MNAKTKTKVAFAALSLMVLLASAAPSLAISAQLAKDCRSAALKAHPTERTGTKGTFIADQRDYYNACLAKNGSCGNTPGRY